MENIFTLEIDHAGTPLVFDARLDTIGFVHKILINVNGIDVTFEPDEERNYRAMVQPAQIAVLKESDKHLIAAIGAALGGIAAEQTTSSGIVPGKGSSS